MTQQLPQQTLLQSSPGTSQPSQTMFHPSPAVVQPLQTLFQPLQTVIQPQHPTPPAPQAVLHTVQAVPRPSQTLIQPPQPVFHTPQPGATDNNPPQPSLVQFTPLPNIFSSPLLNSTVQPPTQHAVPTSLSAPQTSSQTSTLSLLNALHDEKLGLLLPVIVRMDHKMDQLMALMGQMGNQLNALLMANQSNASLMANQPNLSSASLLGNPLEASIMGNQAKASVLGDQSNASLVGCQTTASMGGDRSDGALEGGSQSNAALGRTRRSPSIEQLNNIVSSSLKQTSSNLPRANPTTMETQSRPAATETPSNTETSSEFQLSDSVRELSHGDNIELESDQIVAVANSSTACLPSGSIMTRSQREKNHRGMGKVTEQVLSDDSNFPLSQEYLIRLKAKSNSTMNFSVHLLRELFTLEELEGRNISGSRGKDKVDPKRVEIIKKTVFNTYGTTPSDAEMVWRGCRKAMDTFMRRMKREKVLRENAALQVKAIQEKSQLNL